MHATFLGTGTAKLEKNMNVVKRSVSIGGEGMEQMAGHQTTSESAEENLFAFLDQKNNVESS